MITLEALLESRDRRVQHQKALLQAYPGCSLVCLTVQLPGPEKRSAKSLIVGGAGLAALLDKFGSIARHAHVRDLETGYEAYLLVPMPARTVKHICCQIEETHPLGRLMDLDVLGEDGAPLERTALGLPPRQCLLCGQPARVCMRAKTHSREALEEEIRRRIDAFCNNS